MSSPRYLLPSLWSALLLAALCAGCHQNKAFTTAYIESINAENRQLEDALYLREYEIEKLRREQERRATSDTDARLPREDSPPRRIQRSPSGLRTTPKRTDDLGPPKIEFDEATPAIEGPLQPKSKSRPDPLPDLGPEPRPRATAPPNVDDPPAGPSNSKPIETPLEAKPPTSLKREDDPAPSPPAPTSLPRKTLAPPAKRESKPAVEELPLPKTSVKGVSYEAPVKPSVEQIVLNPARTSGLELDARPGDDGLTLWLEPRDGDGKFLAEAGSVAVVALDPRQTGTSARLARWDLTPQQLSRRLMQVEGVRGYQLQLPWKEKTPEHPAVRVAVRYETNDGRRLEATRELEVALPPEPPQRWLPRSQAQRSEAAPSVPAATSFSSKPAPTHRTVSEVVPESSTESTSATAADSRHADAEEEAPRPAAIKPAVKSPSAATAPTKRGPPAALSEDVEPPRRPTWKPTREADEDE